MAFLIDEGNGGCYMFEWYDRTAEYVMVKGFNVMGEPFEYKGSPEEAKLQEYLNGLPWTENEFNKKMYPASKDCFVGVMVDEFQNAKRFKKMCKDKTLFRLKGDKSGEYRVVKFVYGEEMKDWLAKKYGDQVEEVLNEKFAA